MCMNMYRCIFMYKPRLRLADQTIPVTPRAPPGQQPNTAQSQPSPQPNTAHPLVLIICNINNIHIIRMCNIP